MRVWKRVLFGVLVLGALFLAQDLLVFPGAGTIAYHSIVRPRTRDARLVEASRTVSPSDRKVVRTIFRADGRGQALFGRDMRLPFEWGTEGGVPFTRRMATDIMSGERHGYEVSADGRSLAFTGRRGFCGTDGRMVRE